MEILITSEKKKILILWYAFFFFFNLAASGLGCGTQVQYAIQPINSKSRHLYDVPNLL